MLQLLLLPRHTIGDRMLRVLFIKLIWIVSFLSILAGYVLLSWQVSREYFEYRTSSHVVIKDQPEEIKSPALVVCFQWAIDNASLAYSRRLGDLFTNYFNDENDTWTVARVRAPRIPPNKDIRYESKKYLLKDKYCLYFNVLNHFKLEDVTSSRYSGLPLTYLLDLTTDPIYSGYTAALGSKKKHKCASKFLFISLVTDQSSLPNFRKQEVTQEACIDGTPVYAITMSFSSMVNVRLPPPYDTNCLNYRKEGREGGIGYLSSHECYAHCLQAETQKWNVVPDMAIIDRKEYEGSDAYLAHGIIYDNPAFDLNLLSGENISKDLQDMYVILTREWKGITKSCQDSCSRPDCWIEDISPEILEVITDENYNDENYTFTWLTFEQGLPSQSNIEVSTVPKQNLLNYVIYMLSSLNFWIGFCPLSLASILVRRLQECTYRRVTNDDHNTTMMSEMKQLLLAFDQNQRILSIQQEEKIRTLEEQLMGMAEHLKHLYADQRTRIDHSKLLSFRRTQSSLDIHVRA